MVEGQLTLGEFVQFNAYVGMMAWPMMALGWVATMWQQGSASLKRIHEVLSIQPTIADGQRLDRSERCGARSNSATSAWRSTASPSCATST